MDFFDRLPLAKRVVFDIQKNNLLCHTRQRRLKERFCHSPPFYINGSNARPFGAAHPFGHPADPIRFPFGNKGTISWDSPFRILFFRPIDTGPSCRRDISRGGHFTSWDSPFCQNFLRSSGPLPYGNPQTGDSTFILSSVSGHLTSPAA